MHGEVHLLGGKKERRFVACVLLRARKGTKYDRKDSNQDGTETGSCLETSRLP